MTNSRYKNGYVDDGSLVNNNDPSGQSCPNCKSKNFKETVSREICFACGYEVDYWGKGSNSVAIEFMKKRSEEEAIRKEEEFKQVWEEEYGYPYDERNKRWKQK